MKKSLSATNLHGLGVKKNSPLLLRPSASCNSLVHLFHDFSVSQEIQVMTKAPLHHVASCFAAQEKFPDTILDINMDLASCLASPFDDVNEKTKECTLLVHRNIERSADLLVRVRRSRNNAKRDESI
jgi:hypothetical protein